MKVFVRLTGLISCIYYKYSLSEVISSILKLCTKAIWIKNSVGERFCAEHDSERATETCPSCDWARKKKNNRTQTSFSTFPQRSELNYVTLTTRY